MATKHSKNEIRRFALAFAFVLGLFSIKFAKEGNLLLSGVFLSSSVIALLIGIVQPFLLTPIYKILSSLFKIAITAIATFWLGIIFYCVFTPVSVILRITKKDILGLRIDKDKKTYWIDRTDRIIDPASLEKQY